MTPSNLLAETLQTLPQAVRKTLYTILGLVGIALAVCGSIGIEELGPITLTQALQAYAFLSAATGGVALANVGSGGTAQETTQLSDFDEDADLSSFEPVGRVSDVFEEATA